MTGSAALEIVDYDDSLAGAFHDINAAWIESMFTLEPHDRDVLENPRHHIIDRGGIILFVKHPNHGIVGTGALMPDGKRGIELTKMGVRDGLRGLGAGSLLLTALLARALTLDADRIYLLTNRRCAAAINLYEKHGFSHDGGIMRDFGTVYDRCDVAMIL